MSLSDSRRSAVRFTDSWASVHLDLLRGLAALLVLLEHWRNLFFIDFSQLTAHRRLLAGFFVVTGAGHQSVVVFFVLSGYFIGGTIFRALERDQWEWGGYLLRRMVRLWTVLIPALLLCLFWDLLGIHSKLAPALYSGQAHNNMVGDVAPALMPHVFFGNLFFLQGIMTGMYGTDGALWSLANEFWYYLLFPLALIALWRTQSRFHRLSCAVLFIAAAWFVGAGILINFVIWLAGVALFKLPAPSFPSPMGRYLRIGASILYAPIFLGIGKLHWVNGFVSDYVLAAFTFLFLWVLLSAKDPHPAKARSVLFSREIARFSFTLYAAHVPVLVFLTALLIGDTRWLPRPLTLLAGVGVLFIALVYCWMLAYFTEFRTDRIRGRLEVLFGIAAVPPILPSNPLSETPSGATLLDPSPNL